MLFKVTLIGIFAVLVLSCASVQENEMLFQARAAYEKARTDPMVVNNAPLQLEEARQELNKAEKSESEKELNQRSYMAIKRTEIAVAAAQEKAAQNEIQRLAKERDEIQLTAARREAKMTQAELKALEQELAELKAKKTERGYVVTLSDILFATNRAELMPGAQRNIDQVVAFLNKHPEIRVMAEGHTDSVGSAEYNLILSKARADAVRSTIIARGISPERVTAVGRGEVSPVASNNTSAGRQQNRRVELVFTPALTPSAP